MSFTDPLSVTVTGTTHALPRTSVGDRKSEYTSADGLYVVRASHEGGKGKRTRSMLRIDTSKMAPDAFKPSDVVRKSMSLYIVFDLPPEGYDDADVLAVYTGFKTLITANSDLLITKLLGGES